MVPKDEYPCLLIHSIYSNRPSFGDIAQWQACGSKLPFQMTFNRLPPAVQTRRTTVSVTIGWRQRALSPSVPTCQARRERKRENARTRASCWPARPCRGDHTRADRWADVCCVEYAPRGANTPPALITLAINTALIRRHHHHACTTSFPFPPRASVCYPIQEPISRRGLNAHDKKAFLDNED